MKALLFKNKFEFMKYSIGAVISSFMSLTITMALVYGFRMLEANTTQEMLQIALITFAMFLLVPLLYLISRGLRIGFMRDVLIDVRNASFEQILNMDIQSFRSQPKEAYLSKMVSDLNLFEKDYFLSLLNIISSSVGFAVGAILIWMLVSPFLSIISVIVAGFLYGLSKVFEQPIRKAQVNNQDANAEYNRELSNVLNGLEVMKLYRVEDAFKEITNSIVEKVERLKIRYTRLNGVQTTIIEGVAACFQVFMLVYATYLWAMGDIAIGAMVLVFNLSGSMVWGFVSLTSFINRYKSSVDVYNRLVSSQTYLVQGDRVSQFEEMSIHNLGYAYGDVEVFNNLSFVIKPNTKVLIYGPSGIGKTTLLDCLTHTVNDYKGLVSVNENDLNHVMHSDYLKLCGYVRQQHFMFDASIKENIVLNQAYDEERLKQVLMDVDLWNWVSALDQKWDHELVQNGNNISGGQKQRLSIARELYRDSELLFIDEPSASLDDETSRHIYDTIAGLNRTVVCVSHRHLDYLKNRFDTIVDLGGHSI